MSVGTMSLVFKYDMPELKTDDGRTVPDSTAKFVLLALADHCNDEGEGAYPGVKRICKKTSMSTQTVCNALNALRHNGYTTLEGKSKAETNNYTINLSKLQPLGFQSVESEDSSSQNGTTPAARVKPSVKPSNNHQGVLTDEELRKANAFVDGYLDLAQSPGIKRAARIDSILSYLGGKLKINTETKRWKDFAKFVDDRQQAHHEPLDIFISWLMGQKDFNIQFWSPARMQEMYPQAFLLENQPNTPAINVAAVEHTKAYNEQRWDFKPAPPPPNLTKPVLKAPERRVRK
jgi:hypothetical protein